MSQPYSLLLDLWREVCRQTPVAESLSRAGPILLRDWPDVVVLVRAIDVRTGTIETVAAFGEPLPRQVRSDCPPSHRGRLGDWCRQGGLVRLSARGDAVPGLFPTDSLKDALAVPLPHDEPAALLLVSPRGQLGDAHEALLTSLAEPFAAAWAIDRRLRELNTLRNAAAEDKRSLLTKLGRDDAGETIIGAETGLRRVMQQVRLVAGSDVPVLILGETGSGKEVIARAIHVRSRCADGPCLRVNCGAIPPDLIDSELFGHEKGSFTGASALRTGWFERADGGTLFLDECGELPLAAQVRLLRILQDGTFQRVGGEKQIHVKVRVVAATHRDLRAMVAEGRFREDLWYRLAVFPVYLPALRERPEDVAALATHFAVKAAKRLGTTQLTPSSEDVQLLQGYPWPGNVRELGAVMERAAILGDGKHLEVAQALGSPTPTPRLMMSSPPSPPSEGPFPTLDAAAAKHIKEALSRCRGRVEGPDGAAALLGINPHTLRARMRKLGVDWSRFRSSRRAA